LVRDIAPYPQPDQVFKHTTTPGAPNPSGSNVGDNTDRDAGAGNSDMLSLEDTTTQPLASRRRLLEAGRSLPYLENTGKIR
jgi:hypothetical protein